MRRPVLLALVGVVALALVAVALVLFLKDDEEPAEAAMEGLKTWSGMPNEHVEGPTDYDESPAVGGDHFPAWMDCGAYDAPIAEELAVHDLEHGAVWFAYDADALDDAQVAALEDLLPSNGIMSPYDGLASPVVVSSWERQVAVDEVDDPRIEEFVDTYTNSPIAPESGQVTCAGGLGASDADQLVQQYGL